MSDEKCGNCGDEIKIIDSPIAVYVWEFMCTKCNTSVILSAKTEAEAIASFRLATRADKTDFFNAIDEMKCDVCDKLLGDSGIIFKHHPNCNPKGIQWISVKDRPKESGEYFLCCAETKQAGMAYFHKPSGVWSIIFCNGGKMIPATHWAEINLPDDKDKKE
jgi:hypothetical protein